MAQIYALLLVSSEPLDSDTIMEELYISRGSVNTNLRALMDYGIVEKKLIPGERKEHFVGVKDIWAVFKSIVENRRKKELDPLITELNKLTEVTGDTEEAEEFTGIISELLLVITKANSALDMLLQFDKSWLEEEEFSTIDK